MLGNLLVDRVLCAVIGYFFGMIQTAVFYGKLKGVDIRKVGSGNAGTTNTLRTMGTKAGFIVLFGDMIKCIVAIWLTSFILGKVLPAEVFAQYKWLFRIYTAAGCLLLRVCVKG